MIKIVKVNVCEKVHLVRLTNFIESASAFSVIYHCNLGCNFIVQLKDLICSVHCLPSSSISILQKSPQRTSSKLSFPNSRDRKLWQLLRKVVRRAGIFLSEKDLFDPTSILLSIPFEESDLDNGAS